MWVSLLDEECFVRVAPDGRILDRVVVPGRRGVACLMGGEDRPQAPPEQRSRSRVDSMVVEAPGAGYP